jgi:hypothetical protein
MGKRYKEVYYDKYCSTCKNKKKAENEEPCWECLTTPVNEDSHKPIKYKKA